MALNIGINVLETDGKATPSLVGAATSVGAFLIRSSRGLPGKVARVTATAQVKERFGLPGEGMYGYYALKGFFDNGGVVAYVARVVGAAAAASTNATAFAPLTVTAAYLNEDDPGTWGDRVAVKIVAHDANDLVPNTFDVLIKRDVNDDAPVEVWERVTNAATPVAPARNASAVINHPSSGSKYIRIDAGTSTDNPAAVDYTQLAGGADDDLGAGAIGDDGWTVFDPFNVQLLASPDADIHAGAAAAKAGVDYCAARGDCMYVGFTAETTELGTALADDVKPLRGNKVYGAVYFPWIKVSRVGGGELWVPPVGHVMGVCARTENERGIWKAPAGVQAMVRGALDARQLIGDVDHTDLVKNYSVNAIRFVPGAGFVVDSSRTLSTNPLWYYVNVRLLFNYVKTTLRDGLRWVVQEPNTEELWKKVKVNTVTPFLMGLWRKGAFGPGAAEDVFSVKCDAENNPPANIQQGIFTLEVYFYPSRPAETVVIVVGQQEGASSAQEA